MAFAREMAFAKQLAQEAGRLASDYLRSGVSSEIKGDSSPVTAADRACEQLIVDSITREFPDDGILGEEGANRPGQSGRKWIIDPIDGTRDYVRGIPLWAVLIGLEQDEEIVAAAACNPGQGLTVCAAKGSGAWSDDVRMAIADRTDPRQAVLCFNGFNKPGTQPFADRLLPWVRRFGAVRGFGGSLDAMLLAQGKGDVWIDPNAAPWDLAALKLIVEEAGAKFGNFAGENSIYGGNCYACVPGLESYVRELFI